MRASRMTTVLLWVVLTVGSPACSSTDDTSAGAECTKGDIKVCNGPGLCSGTKACGADHTFGLCTCGGGDSGAKDTTAGDTLVADSLGTDSAPGDTSTVDTSVADTSVADTSTADTSVADTSVADTSVADTSVADTSVADTSVADTSVADTSVADTSTDAGPTSPSCAGGLTCGSVSCCAAKLVPGSTGGTLPMGRSASGTDACPSWDTSSCTTLSNELPEHSATVSDFRLDTFEVTVGRFRKFVTAYPGSIPAAGAGANPKIAASGWQSGWPLPTDQAALIASLKCHATDQTWTDGAGANENKAINCVDWFTAFAFCAWDGGRLPTEAEWEYAAAGGSENRLLPWGGTTLPDCAHANFSGCVGGVSNVGSTPSGAARWGHEDFGGNVWEWILDEWTPSYTSAPCNDCANTSFSANRVWRGGNFLFGASWGRVTYRGADSPARRINVLGLRCARTP